jgi:hypothetical protein
VGRRNVEISALRTLRSGFLFLLVAEIMFVIAVVAGVFSIYAAFFLSLSNPFTPMMPMTFAGALIILLLLLLVSIVILLYAIFGKIRPGMRQLSEVDSGFRVCYKGTTLMIVAFFIAVVGLIIAIAVLASPMPSFAPPLTAIWILMLALVVILVGGIIGLIGNILTFVVGAFKLHGRYQNILYLVAGILFVVDILLMFLGLGGILSAVGCIIMYIALSDTINKLSTATTTPAQA